MSKLSLVPQLLGNQLLQLGDELLRSRQSLRRLSAAILRRMPVSVCS